MTRVELNHRRSGWMTAFGTSRDCSDAARMIFPSLFLVAPPSLYMFNSLTFFADR